MTKKQTSILQTVFGYATGQIACGRTTYVCHKSDKVALRFIQQLKGSALVKVTEQNDLIHVNSAIE